MAEGEEEGGGEGVRGVVEPPGGILVHAEAEGAEVSERREGLGETRRVDKVGVVETEGDEVVEGEGFEESVEEGFGDVSRVEVFEVAEWRGSG